MSVLRAIESKLESLFEGVFGRAFRTNVQPVELARKLVKEMDDHRNVSVSRVYVPNEYTVFLSPEDREQFSSYERQLCAELADYLAEHARRENYALLTSPQVQLDTDDDLDVGVFGIATRLVQTSGGEAVAGRDRPHDDLQAVGRARAAADRGRRRPSSRSCARSPCCAGTASGTRSTRAASCSGARRTPTCRSSTRTCRAATPSCGRRATTYWLVDLDSTNGVEVRGKRVKRLKLEDGTRFTIGSTEIAFSRETE